MLFSTLSNTGRCQSAPNSPMLYDGAIRYQFDLLQTMPGIPMTAPPDVLAGYLYLQYLATNETRHIVDSVTALMTYSDTLKTLTKYLYELDDYDPVLFNRFLFARTHGAFKVEPAYIDVMAMQGAIQNLYSDTLRTAMLTYSDIIARVRINSTRKKIDTLAAVAHYDIVVNATILETLKGQKVPSCIGIGTSVKSGKNQTQQSGDSTSVMTGYSVSTPADSGACIEWEYSPEWPQFIQLHTDQGIGMLVNSDGSDWIKSDSEYIVFLSFMDLGHDSSSDYKTLYSCASEYGHSKGMYAVSAGIVQDAYNDFGCGVFLPRSVFTACLRQRIYNILHF